MKKLALLMALPLALLLSCSSENSSSSSGDTTANSSAGAAYDYDVEQRITDMGITLTTPAPPTASFVKTVRTGNYVYLSGHGPDKPDGTQLTGKLGAGLTLEQGQEAARLTAISLLSSLKAEIGDLNKVRRIVKATGMINAAPNFTQHSLVVNGFSNLMVEIFGDNGKHTRASVGMSSLPNNIAVEIDMVVEVDE